MATDVITTEGHVYLFSQLSREEFAKHNAKHYDGPSQAAIDEVLVGCTLDDIDLDTGEYPSELRDRTFCPCCFLHHEQIDGCTHHSIDGA